MLIASILHLNYILSTFSLYLFLYANSLVQLSICYLTLDLSNVTLKYLGWLSSATRKIFISGVSSQIPLFQDIEPSNAEAQLSHATLILFSLADQCNTQNFISGVSSQIPLIQVIEPSNAGAQLSHATLRLFSLAEQCHTQNFYLRCFKSDLDAVKSEFGLLIQQIEKWTSNHYIF